eukprot:1753749-Rhodomonas_salina.2
MRTACLPSFRPAPPPFPPFPCDVLSCLWKPRFDPCLFSPERKEPEKREGCTGRKSRERGWEEKRRGHGVANSCSYHREREGTLLVPQRKGRNEARRKRKKEREDGESEPASRELEHNTILVCREDTQLVLYSQHPPIPLLSLLPSFRFSAVITCCHISLSKNTARLSRQPLSLVRGSRKSARARFAKILRE